MVDKKRTAAVRYGVCLLLSAMLCILMQSKCFAVDVPLGTDSGETAITVSETSSTEVSESAAVPSDTEEPTVQSPASDASSSTQDDPASDTEAADPASEASPKDENETNERTASEQEQQPESPAPEEPADVTAALGTTSATSGDVSSEAAEAEAVVGQGDTARDYETLAGSVYIREIGKNKTYSNEDDRNAIQAALADALVYARQICETESDANPTATLVVSDGTYQGGIDLTEDSENSPLTDFIKQILQLDVENGRTFTINIVAEDAMVENEDGSVTFTADSEGGAMLEGDVNVKMDGLNLLIAGLFYSTKGVVNVEGANSVDIRGTAQDDVIQVEAANVQDHVSVDAGGGNDTVEVNVSKQTASFAVDVDLDKVQTSVDQLVGITKLLRDNKPEEMPDALFEFSKTVMDGVDSTLQTSLGKLSTVKVDVRLGDGDDTANVKLIDASDIIPTLTPGADASHPNGLVDFCFDLDMNAAEVSIDGGSGNDTITMRGGKECTLAENLTKAVTEYILKQDVDLPETNIIIRGGAGDDTVDVSTTSLRDPGQNGDRR